MAESLAEDPITNTINTDPKTALQNFKDSSREAWSRLSLFNKIAVIVGIPLLIGLLALTFNWSTQKDYRVLFSGLSDKDGGEIIASLQQMQIPYELDEKGSTILVPADKVHQTRLQLATQGFPKGGSVGFELLDNGRLGMTQFQEQVNFQRALEGELSRTIQAIQSVESARVHLALPKPSSFLRDQGKASASVVLHLDSRRGLDRNQVEGIVHLVSSSVPDLAPSAVSVIDQNGMLLSSSVGNRSGMDSTQIQYIQELELQYTQRINQLLTPILGEKNIRAQVAVDVDFSQQERTEEAFKPNTKPEDASIRSQQLSNSLEPATAGPEGVPGSLTNTPPGGGVAPLTGQAQTNPNQQGTGSPNQPPVSRSQNASTTNYELDKTVVYTKEPNARIRRISAAVLVNNRTVIQNGKPTSKPIPTAELDKINTLVREAIGATNNRNDSVTVSNIAFDPSQNLPEPDIPFWKQENFSEQATKGGIGLVILLVILYLIFGIIRPAFKQLTTPPPPLETESVPDITELDEDGLPIITDEKPQTEEDKLAQAKILAMENPQVVASVIRQWLSGE